MRFIHTTRQVSAGHTLIEARSFPVAYDKDGKITSTNTLLTKESDSLTKEEEAILEQADAAYQPYLEATIEIDAELPEMKVQARPQVRRWRGRTSGYILICQGCLAYWPLGYGSEQDQKVYELEMARFTQKSCPHIALPKAEHNSGIKHPHHFVWLEGAEDTPGMITFPRDHYSKVYVVRGTLEFPEIVYLDEVKPGGRQPPRPYYIKEHGKTYVYMDKFSGAGTDQDPWTISTPEELQSIGSGSYSMSDYYLQTADINWLDHANDNFVPIGHLAGTSRTWFTGSYDGAGHTISNLKINISGSRYLGLFAGLNASACTVEDIKFTNVDITGADRYVAVVTGGSYTGATITKCHVLSGTVSNSSSRGAGIAGTIGGPISYCSNAAAIAVDWGISGGITTDNLGTGPFTIEHCYNTGTVNAASSGNVGGIMGIADTTINIYDCYNTGNITASGGNVGGIMGSPNGNIARCFNTGNIEGSSEVGGVTGQGGSANYDDCYSTGSVTATTGVAAGLIGRFNYSTTRACTNCYAAGAVSGPTKGGLIGVDDGVNMGDVIDCFYDTTVSGCSDDDGRGTPLSTADMQTLTTYSTWNIVAIGVYNDEIWYIDDGNDYPRLGYEYEEPVPTTNVTTNAATNITTTAARLNWHVEIPGVE